jgi:alpha-1,3-mannosyltransferase
MVRKMNSTVDVRRIGQIDVAVLEWEDALYLTNEIVKMRRPYRICFANAHTVNMSRKSAHFADSLKGALVLNDGIGVDLASQWLYRCPFPANLNGTDFTPALLDRVASGTRLFLLGGAPSVADIAANAIKAKHGHIEVVGTQHGFFAKADEADVLHRINASGADIVLVAMGHPRQEMWAAQNINRLGVTTLCVGALLDFYAGTARRAPMWVRKLRCEWAFRLLCEPRRLAHRYLIGNGTFLLHTLTSERRERKMDVLPSIRLLEKE